MALQNVSKPPEYLRFLSKSYAALILMLAALTPTFAISYLYFLQDDTLRFESFSFHEVAITVATVQGGFIAYVTYRCYLQTKETFLRWLTLGLL